MEVHTEGMVRVAHPGHGMGVEFPSRTAEQRAQVGSLIDVLRSSPDATPELTISPKALVADLTQFETGQFETADTKAQESDELEDPLLELLRRGTSLQQDEFLVGAPPSAEPGRRRLGLILSFRNPPKFRQLCACDFLATSLPGQVMGRIVEKNFRRAAWRERTWEREALAVTASSKNRRTRPRLWPGSLQLLAVCSTPMRVRYRNCIAR